MMASSRLAIGFGRFGSCVALTIHYLTVSSSHGLLGKQQEEMRRVGLS
jgi:hypothetical protein